MPTDNEVKKESMVGGTDAAGSALDDVFGTKVYQEIKAETERRKAERKAKMKDNPVSQIMRNVISFKTMEYQAGMTAGLINDDGRKHDERRDKYEERDEALEERNALMMGGNGNSELLAAMNKNNELMGQLIEAQSGGRRSRAAHRKPGMQAEAQPEQRKSSVRRMMEARAESLGEDIHGNEPQAGDEEFGK